MCLPSDCRGEDGNRNLMTKVMRKSGEKLPKSSLAAFYLSIHPSKSLPIQPIKFSRLVVAIEIFTISSSLNVWPFYSQITGQNKD